MIRITSQPSGTAGSGESVFRYTMENDRGMKVSVLNYGGIIQSIRIPAADRTASAGQSETDVVLGYDDLAGYEQGSCFLGAFVGRYANRIKGAVFDLNGEHYELPKNDGQNHLHGTFCRTVFDIAVQEDSLLLSHTFPDGEEGYPGTLAVSARYRLTEDCALELEYFAETDADRVISLTNHSYFNLNGEGDILHHRLQLFADRFTEGNEETIPTGRILPVEGTPLDFRAGKEIGAEIFSDCDQIRLCRGYDHNFALWREAAGCWIPENEPVRCARAAGDRSGIVLEAFTTQPGVQLYTGNFLDGDEAAHGKAGVRYPRYGGFCLETQAFPCAPNFAQFPDAVLRAGERYHHRTIYRFSAQ